MCCCQFVSIAGDGQANGNGKGAYANDLATGNGKGYGNGYDLTKGKDGVTARGGWRARMVPLISAILTKDWAEVGSNTYVNV